MADSDSGEKTEEPTQQRREDFRKRGQVAQTKELSAVFVLFASLLLIWLLGRFFLSEIFELFQVVLGEGVAEAHSSADFGPLSILALKKMFVLTAPVGGILWLISFASTAVQIGFLYNEEALQFKVERMDPIQGLKRIFSMKSLMEGIKAIFKLSVILGIAYFVLKDKAFELPFLMNYSISQIFVYLGDLLLRLLGAVGSFMVVLAGVDYLFQRYELDKEMMMTKQEVKEEMKSREGDPLIKARIKRIQREMSTRRMMEDVPKADVIVTNPTHIAVALQYNEGLVAPKVIAKGAESVAEKIKALAREHKIPVVENKPLARAIFKTMKIGQVIPRELYTAVAEVLSYVYKLKNKVVR
ncbi:MAG: flagellar biosynthesis protein FlhB [Bdellovibrionales bacterium]|nr:flagellar biosynthesis protein FlhB [Bdellovibrionales bacterium]